ncbi:MAG: hypothetical protein Kow0049_33970 [Stanieria sp.]
MLLWRNYQTDIGRVYPFYALAVRQINDINTAINPIDLLPASDLSKEGV